MLIHVVYLAAIALSACQTANGPALFDPSALQASAEDQTTALTGWLSVTGEDGLVLYPTHASLTAKTRPGCVAVRALSTAGIVAPDYHGKQMTVQGQLTAQPGAGCGMTLMASDISVP